MCSVPVHGASFKNWITPLGLTLWKVKGFPDCGCYCKFIYSNMQGRKTKKCLSTCLVYDEEMVGRWNERSCYMQLNFRFFKRKLKRKHRQNANMNLNLKNSHFNLYFFPFVRFYFCKMNDIWLAKNVYFLAIYVQTSYTYS